MSTYPAMYQYNEAVQSPRTAFSDPTLKAGTVAKNGNGIPVALGGGFALTYTVTSHGKKFAVRCFHKTANGLAERYARISQALSVVRSTYFVGFEYQSQGILVSGNKYPVVKMDWVEGETLGTYLESHHSNKESLARLRNNFLALEKFLRHQSIAHGDLQNGNIIVGNNVTLIDYDGLYVLGLPTGQGNELGHRHFQHPKRTGNNFGPEMDRFSFLTIDLSLRALLENAALFQKYSNGENILFTASDFADPSSSRIFAELRSIPALTKDIENFIRVCTAPITKVPTLEDFLAGQGIPAQTISLTPPAGVPHPTTPTTYISAYDVLDATDFNGVQRQIGNRIELIGQIIGVKLTTTRRGHRPFVFINFGNWRELTTKITIWSEGLKKLINQPSASWTGKWISVTGLVDPLYVSTDYHYTHLSITVTEANQLRIIDKAEAQRRLASVHTEGRNEPSGGNLNISPNLGSGRTTTSNPEKSTYKNQDILTWLGFGKKPPSPPLPPVGEKKTNLDILREIQNSGGSSPASPPSRNRPENLVKAPPQKQSGFLHRVRTWFRSFSQ